ncbi:chromosome partitioning protein ParA [Bordetella genomosp. 8]|uniref:Chromosome partitioning protein ParA n=1 Tax=Bordetella genomosp. 8 TaxID=1416806 RepID=A0A1W6YPL8_9BORD|nr:DUF1365 domain-containing protein [Bordetella genomosp. 8]ARP82869.1 chromosome partitioning protein ParA [Bordetella genomosp. 8]
MKSALYEGRVMHKRHLPHMHAFDFRMAQLYLDLDEIDEVFRGRWLWSTDRPNLAQWRRADYLDGAATDGAASLSLKDAVRARLGQAMDSVPAGPIRLLAHARYAGHVFNPVSFYYCYEADGVTLAAIVAEITNTPWKQRHCIVLPVDAARRRGEFYTWAFDKRFHVSPFMPMDCAYDWTLTAPAEDLRVHMRVSHQDRAQFDAHLYLRRRTLDGAALARVLWRFPLMTLQVIGAIHWQALRLWLKRNPVYDHPGTPNGEPE